MSSQATASIVLFKHSADDVLPVFQALHDSGAISSWVVVNNGGAEQACLTAEALGARSVHPDRNLGYGAGHNLALKTLFPSKAPYHLILNPDVDVDPQVVDQLARLMDAMPQVGVVMPRVIYPDGAIQHLCKLVPTPLDLVLRRFAIPPLRWLFQSRMDRYDMKSFDYARPVYVPVLSGCFMFTRRSVLDSVGGFDERFFLYMEDTDLCRRMGEESRLLFWPGATVTHAHAAGSYKKLSMLRLHLRSAIAYFNKWGWFNDPVRDAMNSAGLQEAQSDLPDPEAPTTHG